MMEGMNHIAAILIFCSLAGFAQDASPRTAAPKARESSSNPAPKTEAPKKRAPRNTALGLPDEGAVADDVYSEKFFNLRYVIPQGWTLKTAEMRPGLGQPDKAILLLSAFAKQKPASGEIDSSVTVTAENISLYPDVKTADDYFDSLAELVKGKGFSVLNQPAEIQLAGVTFLRGDFQKQEGDLTTYQATMIAIRKGYILQITAISGNEEQLTPLLNRLQIFAPPTLSRTP
jgi:hypothetical protein